MPVLPVGVKKVMSLSRRKGDEPQQRPGVPLRNSGPLRCGRSWLFSQLLPQYLVPRLLVVVVSFGSILTVLALFVGLGA